MRKVYICLSILCFASCLFENDSIIDIKISSKLKEYERIAHILDGSCHVSTEKSYVIAMIECLVATEMQLKHTHELIQAKINSSGNKSLRIKKERSRGTTLMFHDSEDKNLPMLLSFSLIDDEFEIKFSLCGVKLFQKITSSILSYVNYLDNEVSGKEMAIFFDTDNHIPVIHKWLIKTNRSRDRFYRGIWLSANELSRDKLEDQLTMANILLFDAEFDSAKPVNKEEKCLVHVEKYRKSRKHIDFNSFYNDPATEELVLEIHRINFE